MGSVEQPVGRVRSVPVGGVGRFAIDSPWRSLPVTWVPSAYTVVIYSIGVCTLKSSVPTGVRDYKMSKD